MDINPEDVLVKEEKKQTVITREKKRKEANKRRNELAKLKAKIYETNAIIKNPDIVFKAEAHKKKKRQMTKTSRKINRRK